MDILQDLASSFDRAQLALLTFAAGMVWACVGGMIRAWRR
jgi:hypothetical protein